MVMFYREGAKGAKGRGGKNGLLVKSYLLLGEKRTTEGTELLRTLKRRGEERNAEAQRAKRDAEGRMGYWLKVICYWERREPLRELSY